MKEEDINNLINNPSRLRWACRRGMLELDVLLVNFLGEAYPKLSVENKKRFVRLLDNPDPELIDWLMGYAKPEDPDLMIITEEIRRHAKSRI